MRRRYTIAITLAILFFWIWAVVVEPYGMLVVKEQTVKVKDFPENFEKLKIAVVSDIHVGRGFWESWRMKRIIRAVNRQNPDVIIFLGDYTNGYPFQTSPSDADLIAYFSAFNAKYGKFGIYGNHEYVGGPARMAKILAASGVELLNNSNALVKTPYGSFYLAAIADPQTMDYSYGAALNGIPDETPLIFLTHDPAVLREIPQRVNIVLSGHTHGGQFRLPWIGNIMPIRHTQRKYVGQTQYYDGRLLSINSKGLGTSRIPARFFCPPELTILRIVPKKIKEYK